MRTRCRLALLTLLLVGLCPLLAGAEAVGQLPQTQPRDDLALRGLARTVFQQLGELYHVPIEVDKAFPSRPLDIHLRHVDFATALHDIAILAQAFWVVRPDGTVLIAADTPDKRKEYEPMVLQTFALPGYTSDQMEEAVRLLRDLLDMRRIRLDTSSNAFTVRDTPQRLAVARQLLDQIQPDAGEIMVDALLIEVDRNRALQFGLFAPDNFVIVHLGAGALAIHDANSLITVLQFLIQNNLLPSILSPAVSSAISAGVTDPAQLAALLPPFILFGGGGTTFAAHFPSPELKLSQVLSATRGVRQFSLRARSGEKATLFSGELYPVIVATFSSSFIPAVVQQLIQSGQFVPPVPAVQYTELGARLTVTPRVLPNREVSLAIKFEQKDLSGQSVNGIPVLSSRDLEQTVRVRDGETIILGGLRSRIRTENTNGLPGLAAAPGFNPLFAQLSPSSDTSEDFLFLTPHIIRLPARDLVAQRTLYVGTEKDFAPVGKPAFPEAPPPAAPKGPAAPTTPTTPTTPTRPTPQQPQQPGQPPPANQPPGGQTPPPNPQN